MLREFFAPDAPSTTLERETLADLLSSERRIAALELLSESPRGIGSLARALAARTQDVPPATVDASQRKRAYVSLYQTHIPIFEEHGLVAEAGDEYELTERGEDVVAVAEELDGMTGGSR